MLVYVIKRKVLFPMLEHVYHDLNKFTHVTNVLLYFLKTVIFSAFFKNLITLYL